MVAAEAGLVPAAQVDMVPSQVTATLSVGISLGLLLQVLLVVTAWLKMLPVHGFLVVRLLQPGTSQPVVVTHLRAEEVTLIVVVGEGVTLAEVVELVCVTLAGVGIALLKSQLEVVVAAASAPHHLFPAQTG